MGDHARARRSRTWSSEAGDAGRDVPACERELVDWRRLRRRLSVLALGWGGLAVLGVGSTTALRGDLGAGALWAGVVAVGFLASALAAVALSALGGMLRAGERRQRLASGDVGLMPPQVRRRRSARRT